MIECGNALLQKGYKLKIFNTINFSKSMKYNPMAYIHSEKDILKLVTALMTNTKGEGQGGDPFWDKAERLLLVSLIAYLHYEAPVEEQNFATLLEMLNTMQVSEDDETYQNPVDLLFEDLGKKKPKSFAVRQYKLYKLAAGAADYQHVFVPGILGVRWAVGHHQAFCFGQNDIVLKLRSHKWLYILRSAPPGGAVLHAVTVLLGVFAFQIHRQPHRGTAA